MGKKANKLLKDTIIFTIGGISSKIIQLLLVPLYTYTLTSSEYGVTDLVMTLTNFLMPIFSIQLTDTLLRFGLDRKRNQKQVIDSTFYILRFTSIIALLFSPVLLLLPSIREWCIFFVILLLLRMYRDILFVVLKIKDKNRVIAIDSFVFSLILVLSCVALLGFLHAGIVGYFFSYIIANIASILFLFKKSEWRKAKNYKKDRKLIKEMLLYSAPLIVSSLSYWIITASDRFMIDAMKGTSEVGIYAISSKIPLLIATFTGFFNQAWLLTSINEYEETKNDSIQKSTLNMFSGISFFVCTAIIPFIKPFLDVFINNEYGDAWGPSLILVLSAVFSGICAIQNSILYAYKKNVSSTVTTGIGAIINIALNLILINLFGIMGAAIATLASWIVVYCIRLYVINENLQIKTGIITTAISLSLILVEIYTLLFIKNSSTIIALSFLSITVMFILHIRAISSVCKLVSRVFRSKK